MNRQLNASKRNWPGKAGVVEARKGKNYKTASAKALDACLKPAYILPTSSRAHRAIRQSTSTKPSSETKTFRSEEVAHV